MREVPRRTRSGDGSGMLTLSELSGSVGRGEGRETDRLVPIEDVPASSLSGNDKKSKDFVSVVEDAPRKPCRTAFRSSAPQDPWCLHLQTGTVSLEKGC